MAFELFLAIMRGGKVFRDGMVDAHEARGILINLKMAKNVSRGKNVTKRVKVSKSAY